MVRFERGFAAYFVFEKNRSGFPGFHPGLFSFPPSGRENCARLGRGFAGRSGRQREGWGSCDPGSQKRDPGHPRSCRVGFWLPRYCDSGAAIVDSLVVLWRV